MMRYLFSATFSDSFLAAIVLKLWVRLCLHSPFCSFFACICVCGWCALASRFGWYSMLNVVAHYRNRSRTSAPSSVDGFTKNVVLQAAKCIGQWTTKSHKVNCHKVHTFALTKIDPEIWEFQSRKVVFHLPVGLYYSERVWTFPRIIKFQECDSSNLGVSIDVALYNPCGLVETIYHFWGWINPIDSVTHSIRCRPGVCSSGPALRRRDAGGRMVGKPMYDLHLCMCMWYTVKVGKNRSCISAWYTVYLYGCLCICLCVVMCMVVVESRVHPP